MAIVGKGRLARAVRAWSCAVAVLAAGVGVASRAPAQDSNAALHELADSTDFRVRVSAALIIGRTKPAGGREALERALSDPHPAVRIAVITALGALADTDSLPALERRLRAEPSPGVVAQLRTTIDALHRGPASDSGDDDGSPQQIPAGARYVVKLGTMRNAAGVRGEDLRRVLRNSTRTRARELKDAAVLENDSPLLAQAARRHLPVVTLDGNVTQLLESRIASSMQVQAHVEFTVRRDQTLRGTLSGGATTSGSGPTLTDDGRKRLEDEAVDGAVQSALRGADQGLMVAAR
jgi:hypothetical protein